MSLDGVDIKKQQQNKQKEDFIFIPAGFSRLMVNFKSADFQKKKTR